MVREASSMCGSRPGRRGCRVVKHLATADQPLAEGDHAFLLK